MEDKDLRTVSSQVLELQQLIAAPLIATIEADSLSAQKYLDYLMKIAFESYDPKSGTTGKIRMLSFNYTSQDVTGSREQKVSIPLFTLVPLPLLQIKEADFDFDIKILDAFSVSEDEKFSLEKEESDVTSQSSGGFKMRASLAPRQSNGNTSKNVEQSLTANMKVKVKMRQADVPAGLSNLLHLAASNMRVEEMEEVKLKNK